MARLAANDIPKLAPVNSGKDDLHSSSGERPLVGQRYDAIGPPDNAPRIKDPINFQWQTEKCGGTGSIIFKRITISSVTIAAGKNR